MSLCQLFFCGSLLCTVALLAGCQANWMSPAEPQMPLKSSQTKVTVTVASPRPQPIPATQPDVTDERATQLTQEIQDYVSNLAMDDLQAKLSRHEGRPAAPAATPADSPAVEPAEEPAAVTANPQPIAPPVATGPKTSDAVAGPAPVAQPPVIPSAKAGAAPASPALTAKTPVPASPGMTAPAANQHVPLEPELIVPAAADQETPKPQPTPTLPVARAEQPAPRQQPAAPPAGTADRMPLKQPPSPAPPAAVSAAPASLRTETRVSPSHTTASAGPAAAPLPATTPQTGPQVVSIDISPAVLSTLATQPSPRAVQPRTNQPAAVKPGPSDDLKHLIEQLRKEAGDRPDSVGAALRLRLAEWSLLGTVSPDEWPLQDADKRRLAQSVWQVLQVVSKMEASPQGAPGDEFQKAIESLTETLQQVQPLQIPAALLCRSVSSFGCPDAMPEPWQFPVGRTSMVVLYCELAGFKSEPVPAKANQYHTLLSQRLAILTAAGKELWNYEDQQVEDFCRRPRRDFFITKLLKIPPELPAGDYVLKVTIRDKLANRVTETNIPFGITLATGLADQK